MTSVNPVSPTEQQTQSPFEGLNSLIVATQTSIRDDNTLTDCLVRLRNLHSEVKNAITTGNINSVGGVSVAQPKTLNKVTQWSADPDCDTLQDAIIPGFTLLGNARDDSGDTDGTDKTVNNVSLDDNLAMEIVTDVHTLKMADMPYGTLKGRCHAGTGAPNNINIGNGFAITEDGDDCTITTSAGRALFVRNTTTDESFTIPDFITLMQYQITGGGSSGCKTTNLTHACSGGSGETQIGSLTVASGDVIRVIIPAAVGSSLTTDEPNIAGGNVEIKVNGVTKVLAKGAAGGLTSNSTSFTFPGGTGGTTPASMAHWDGGVGRRDSSGTAFGAGVRGIGSGCGGNVSSASGAVTEAGCGFIIIKY